MSDALSGYYVAIKCSSGEKESRFARLKDFLLTAISRLVSRLRKWFSRVIFNGRPVGEKPEETLPPGLRRLSHKKLKKIKKALGEFISETQTTHDGRSGNLPPPPTRCVSNEDLEIEIFRAKPEPSAETKSEATADEKPSTQEVATEDTNDATAKEDVSGEPETAAAVDVDEIQVVRKKLPRPKAAKGRRVDTVIPDYIIIDNEEVRTLDTTCRRNRPKAAKGTRTVCCDHPIDLPAEVLIDRYQDPDRRRRAISRQRPPTPRPRPLHVEEKVHEKDLDTQVDELLAELRSITVVKPEKTESHALRQESHIKREGGQAYKESSAHRHIKREENQAPAAVAVGGAKLTSRGKKATKKRAEKSEPDEDLFNVPYLPRSQRNHASSGLSLPWLD